MKKILIISLSLLLLPFLAEAQCKSWTKRKALPLVTPYKFNETYTSAEMVPGEEATVKQTFFSGQEYRLVVAAQKLIGPVNWKLKSGGNVIFESLADDPKDFYDFKMGSTQQLDVVIWVPDHGESTTGIVTPGCVSILVGFKE